MKKKVLVSLFPTDQMMSMSITKIRLTDLIIICLRIYLIHLINCHSPFLSDLNKKRDMSHFSVFHLMVKQKSNGCNVHGPRTAEEMCSELINSGMSFPLD